MQGVTFDDYVATIVIVLNVAFVIPMIVESFISTRQNIHKVKAGPTATTDEP